MNRPLHLQTRREFLVTGLKGVTLAAAAPYVPSFLAGSAYAGPQKETPAWLNNNTGRLLVVIQLGGGNDGLNTVIPFSNDEYHKARPTIGFDQGVTHPLNDELGLHPDMRPFKELYDAGNLAVVQGVGYPNPNRSHFRSMEIWHAGMEPDRAFRNGWLGRYVDAQCSGEDRPSPTVGVNIGRVMPGALRGEENLGISLEDPAAYQWNPSGHSKAIIRAQEEIYAALNTPGDESDPELNLLQHIGLNANLSADNLREILTRYKTKESYPNNKLGTSLELIARMIAGGLDTRIFYAHQGGYDTHNNQDSRHGQLLGDLTASIAAFQRDLQAMGAADRVTTLVFSEFGRRVQENDSAGTDHGAAAPVFVIGEPVAGGVYGEHPSLTDLANGDLKYGTDFRRIYAGVLDQWLGAKSKDILGKSFDPLPLFKA